MATAITSVLWLACLAVFSDLCLSFGGANPGCTPTFNYPDAVQLFAMFGVVLLIPLILVIAVLALVFTVLASARKARA